jgi:tRNA-modifying protein YgfZ
MNQNYLAALEDFAILRIAGAQAGDFLQGQLTADVRTLSNNQAILAACCDHKGRMLFNGWLGRQLDTFFLLLPRHLLAFAQTHLQKFILRSKVQLSEAIEWTGLHYTGGDLSTLPDPSACIYARLPHLDNENSYSHWLFGPNSAIRSLQKTLLSQATWADQALRDDLILSTHLVFIQPQTQGLFIPQMIGLEKLGGVSFNKGCYAGQEVIARTQHLGQLKRHLRLLQSDAKHPRFPGETLRNAHNEPIGQIAAVSLVSDRLLAVIQDGAITE